MKSAAVACFVLFTGLADPAAAEDLARRYGLMIIDHDLATEVVPNAQPPDRHLQMSDIANQDEATCVASAEHALAAYPNAFVRALVQRLVFAGDIHLWDRRVGGLQVPGLIAINCIEAANNVDHDIASVHDAIAAKVLTAAPPDWVQWEAGNPPGFRYGDLDAYKSALSDPNVRELTDKLNRDGFVGRFGLSGREADFQTYAEQAFGYGPEFAAVVRAHPAMRGKLRLLMQSYIRVAPDLADRFKASGLDQMAALP